MIDWQQRAMTTRAARRLILELDDMARDVSLLGFESETQEEDEARLDTSFRALYTRLQDLIGSLPLTSRETVPTESVPEFSGSFDFSAMGNLDPRQGAKGRCPATIKHIAREEFQQCELDFGHPENMHRIRLDDEHFYWGP